METYGNLVPPPTPDRNHINLGQLVVAVVVSAIPVASHKKQDCHSPRTATPDSLGVACVKASLARRRDPCRTSEQPHESMTCNCDDCRQPH